MTATWEFEPADPEVGFLSDFITHACEANADDAQPAEEVATHTWEVPGGLVNVQTVLCCPACHATTTYTEQWPLSFFEEPRDADE